MRITEEQTVFDEYDTTRFELEPWMIGEQLIRKNKKVQCSIYQNLTVDETHYSSATVEGLNSDCRHTTVNAYDLTRHPVTSRAEQ